MKLNDLDPQRGPLHWLARLPVWLYHAHLGWLLGNQFLLLTHTGRKSGLPREVVLEVVNHDPAAGVYMVASGWGEKADWFRNIQQTPQVRVCVGRQVFAARAERLSVAEAEQAVREYAQRHPHAFRTLAHLLVNKPSGGASVDYRDLARELPLVSLRPISQLV